MKYIFNIILWHNNTTFKCVIILHYDLLRITSIFLVLRLKTPHDADSANIELLIVSIPSFNSIVNRDQIWRKCWSSIIVIQHLLLHCHQLMYKMRHLYIILQSLCKPPFAANLKQIKVWSCWCHKVTVTYW